jgi:hypothetical protein
MHLHFYWTASDTLSALAATSGAMLGLFIDVLYKRLSRR